MAVRDQHAMSTERRPGRDGAVDALLDAAEALFVERGPAAVSLRDVARRAGVNHGLIHHYIGSRDDLLELVFTRATERARAAVVDLDDPADALDALRSLGGASDSYTRLLAWALLEGHDPAKFHGRSAALEAIVQGSGSDTRSLRVALAASMVQTLGWKLFGEYALVAAGLDDEDASSVRTSMDEWVRTAVASPGHDAKRSRRRSAAPATS
jgi:AcrR family transcriptional regulator